MRKIQIKIYRILSSGTVNYIGYFKFKIKNDFWNEFYQYLLGALKSKKIKNRAEMFVVLFKEEEDKEIFIYYRKISKIPDEFIHTNLVDIILKNQKWFSKKAFSGVIEE